jgi:hypothetical protein
VREEGSGPGHLFGDPLGEQRCGITTTKVAATRFGLDLRSNRGLAGDDVLPQKTVGVSAASSIRLARPFSTLPDDDNGLHLTWSSQSRVRMTHGDLASRICVTAWHRFSSVPR